MFNGKPHGDRTRMKTRYRIAHLRLIVNDKPIGENTTPDAVYIIASERNYFISASQTA